MGHSGSRRNLTRVQLGSFRASSNQTAMPADIASMKKEWNACLSKSNGAPGKCEKLEKEFRAAAKAANVESCADETVALMKCTQSSSKAGGCSEAFLTMRECNRAGG